jgi:FkbM family methyltransferase
MLEARAIFNRYRRRELRDEWALQVILAASLRADSNVIDVGANDGAVLDSIVRLAPLGRHIAYEPIPELHEILAHRYPQVDLRRAALSDSAGQATFKHVLDRPAVSGLRVRRDVQDSPGAVREIVVNTERLDDVLDVDYVPAVIKIDVEGAEFGVMRGAARTLERHRPLVLFEHGSGGADLYGTGPGDVFDLLDQCRLRIFDLDGKGPYSRELFEETFTEPVWNFLASPA